MCTPLGNDLGEVTELGQVKNLKFHAMAVFKNEDHPTAAHTCYSFWTQLQFDGSAFCHKLLGRRAMASLSESPTEIVVKHF